jgi:RNA polymerase sigma-70 factor (ECF subfamily)
LARQRAVVNAYFAAAREGDLNGLVAVLDPDVALRAHTRGGVIELRGRENVARGAMAARRYAPFVRPALVNGTAGAVAFDGDVAFAILAFTIAGDRAVTIDIFNDRELVPRMVRERVGDGSRPGDR